MEVGLVADTDWKKDNHHTVWTGQGGPRTEPVCWAGNGAPGTHRAGEAGEVLKQEKMLAEIG